MGRTKVACTKIEEVRVKRVSRGRVRAEQGEIRGRVRAEAGKRRSRDRAEAG
jgi:hypothetical protein